MVQEYVSPVRVHKYPFEMVMAAYERRFPSCPQIPVVIDCVITEDSWSADDSQRQTTRRCQLNVDAPYLLKKMIGVDYIYFIQKNSLDLRSRVLEIEATNETFASRVSVVENCRYFVHPENSEWTCFEQRALLDVKNFFGLENTVEKIAMKQYAANIAKGKELIEIFMQGVHEDGVKELKPWSASDPRNNRELRRVVSRGTEPLSPRPAADAKRHSIPGTSQSGIWSNPSLRKSSPKMFRNRSKSVISLRDQKNNISKQSDKIDVVGNSNSNRSKQKLDSGQSTTKIAHRRSEVKVRDDKKDDDRKRRVAISSPDLTRRHSMDVSSLKELNLVKPCTCDPQASPINVAELFSSLDSEYIKRYLGELTPTQEARLLQLRKWIAELQKGKVPSDTTLLRFLRARDFSVEKAREMLSQSLLWRKKHQVDRLLSEYQTPEVVRQYFPGGWHHHDKDGRPLYILRLGQMDVKGLLKSIGEDGLLKLTLHVCEEGLKLLEEASRSMERAVQAWCLLVDLDGLNMRHLWRPGVRALLRIIQIVEDNYPETMGRVLIVRAPRVFPILWTIVSTFIDENTRSKFLFYGGKDYLQPGGLLDYIPKDLIPDFLGGPCKSFVHEGGLVPKSLYVSGAFTERDGDPLSEDSIYKSVSLARGQVHEVVVHNRDPNSVLTWDFDVLRHDVYFSVYRTSKELQHTEQPAAGDESRSVLEGAGREGEHYHRVETALLCHDGESIQGSHVMSSRGSYVLQWRCEGARGPDGAQLVYFHETLASHHYRGSMSSLQSATSGFSCLSGSSSCPSR